MLQIISILFLVYIGMMVLVLILERRKPTSTLAWILVLTLLPYLGFVVYLLFGRDLSKRKIFSLKKDEKKQLLKLVKAQGKFIKEGELNYKDDSVRSHLSLIQMNLRAAHAIYSQDNSVQIFIDGKEKFTRLFSSIREAKEQIHLEYFIVRNDTIANHMIDLLIQKAEAGVEVRFLVDFLGNRIKASRIKEMRKAGVQVAKFFPSRFFPYVEIMVNNRNHRKIVIIDGKEAFLGGYNVGNEYLGLDSSKGAWRDTHIVVTGSAVLEIQNRFIMDWRASGGDAEGSEKLSFPKTIGTGNVGMQIVSSGPESQMEQIKYSYLAMINVAKKRILIQSPYFIPDEPMIDALKMALLRGVEVLITIPNKPDHIFVYWATFSYIGDLLPFGLKAYIYQDGFMHAKTMVVDEEVFTCGTANFDIRSFRLNFEVNAFIYDKNVAQEYTQIYYKDIKKSRQLTLADYENRSWVIKLKEPISRLMSPVL